VSSTLLRPAGETTVSPNIYSKSVYPRHSYGTVNGGWSQTHKARNRPGE
jgi:hypothetical protein